MESPGEDSPLRPRLDPCCDYVVFETSPDQAGSWTAVRRAMDAHRGDILEEALFGDAHRARLVFKLAPEAAEAVKRAVLDMDLPEDLVVFVYHRFDEAGEGSRP
jgi:hypothetical protein